MTYNEAIKLVEEHEGDIGKVDSNGFKTGTLIPVPSDPQKGERFIKSWMISRDAHKSAIPFLNDDFVVWAIDTDYIDNANILFYDILK